MPMEDSKKTGPRDVFSHVLAIVFLYACVISFGIILFQYINIYFPDPLNGVYGSSARDAIRVPLSILVIVFPFVVWLTASRQRDLIRNPEKRELKPRRWLLYFTLFLTTIVIVADLVTLVYRFLSGELTVRFFLKVGAVLIIAASVFVYYLWNLRRDTPALSHPKMKLFVYGVLVFAGLAIVFGFFTAGSPFAERLRRFDGERESQLQSIQWEITNFWQLKTRLPQNLDELNDDLRGYRTPRDPETGLSYEYRITGNTSFELCAIFTLESSTTNHVAVPIPYGGESEIWSHGVGKKCFSRTIDPERFPPLKKLQ